MTNFNFPQVNNCYQYTKLNFGQESPHMGFCCNLSLLSPFQMESGIFAYMSSFFITPMKIHISGMSLLHHH